MKELIVKSELEIVKSKLKNEKEKNKKLQNNIKEIIYYILDNRLGNVIDTDEVISMLRELI